MVPVQVLLERAVLDGSMGGPSWLSHTNSSSQERTTSWESGGKARHSGRDKNEALSGRLSGGGTTGISCPGTAMLLWKRGELSPRTLGPTNGPK